MPKISVIIPLYNDADYIENSVGSVQRQSLSDIEIICIDDSSTDDTKRRLQDIATADSRVHTIFHSKNLGTCQSRKDGVLASTGDYIMFLDGDDSLTPDACKIAYEAIDNAKVDIVHFGTEVNNCGNIGEIRIRNVEQMLSPHLGKIVEKSNLVKQCFEYHKFGAGLWDKIYEGTYCRKSFRYIEEGRFTKGEDRYALLVLSYYASSYLGIEKKLYIYNFGLGSTGGDIISLNQYLPFLDEKNTYEAIVRFLLSKPDLKHYKTIIQSLYNQFLGECVYKWKDNLLLSDKESGFDSLIQAWGCDAVISFMIEHLWYQVSDIVKMIPRTNTFKYIKRDFGKKITIAAYYRCIVGGGAQRVTALLCNRWADLKDKDGNYIYNVVLITDDGPLKDEYELNPRVMRAYLPSFLVSKQKNYKKRYDAWQDIITEYGIDIVVDGLWVDRCTFWDALAVKSHPLHPAFIVHAHSFCAVPFQFSGDESYTISTMYQFCDGVTALSPCDELYISSFANHSKFIFNPLAFDPSSLPFSEYLPNMIVWVGRISPEKRPLDAIRMMAKVKEKIPGAKLYIIGDGDKNILNQMKSTVKLLGLSQNVIFTGFTLDVAKYYALASCFICTSEYEGFPLTIGESLSYGLPVVTYAMDWLSFTQDGRGIISVPQGNYLKMADEVIDILLHRDKMKKIGLEGKQQIEEIGAADIESDWQELFREINEDLKDNDSTIETADALESEHIIFKYLTSFQNEGKQRRVTNISNACKQKSRNEIIQLDKRYNELTDSYESLRNSRSYKMGRFLTFIPRKTRGGIRCFQEHDLKYTIRRTLWHLGFISSWKE